MFRALVKPLTYSHRLFSGGHSKRGMSMVELMISLALLTLLSLVTVSGMIYHSRVAKSNLSRQRIAEGARRFVQGAQIAMIDSTIARVDTGPSGPNTVLTIGRPDPNNPGSVVFTQYAYIDRDSNPNTLNDNVIVVRNQDSPLATTGDVIIELASRVTGQNVFTQMPAAYPLFEINLHVGDRTFPASNADNAFTGPGFQGYRIKALAGRGN